MTATEQIRALIDMNKIRLRRANNVLEDVELAAYRECLAIVEAEDAKRAPAIKAMVEALRAFVGCQQYDVEGTYVGWSITGLRAAVPVAAHALNLACAAGLTEDKG